MSKFLYITDQDEYADHSFIGPLFQKYLTKHFDINTTFFSKEKSQRKNTRTLYYSLSGTRRSRRCTGLLCKTVAA